MRRFHVTSFVLVLLAAQPLLAGTYYVGSCKIKKGYYTSIGAAVAGVPAGSTVEVCPGTYYEQVVISQPLTLEGIPNWSTGPVVISDAGVSLTTTTSMSAGTVAPQVWVTTGPVNITNVTVNQTATPPPNEIGIFYASGSSGTVKGTAVHAGTYNYVGIVAENGAGVTQSVTIEDNYLSGQMSGISIDSDQDPSSLSATVKNNYISIAGGGTALLAFENAQGSMSNNFVTFTIPGEGNGVLAASANVAISGNWILNAGLVGIIVGSTSVTLTSNQIFGAGTGISVENGGTTGDATIKGNAIVDTVGAAVEFNCTTNNTVTGNTINTAAVGLDEVPAGFTGSNTFYNVTTKITDGCS